MGPVERSPGVWKHPSQWRGQDLYYRATRLAFAYVLWYGNCNDKLYGTVRRRTIQFRVIWLEQYM